MKRGHATHYLVHVASRIQTWAEECVNLHEVLKIEILGSFAVACPLFFYTPLVIIIS